MNGHDSDLYKAASLYYVQGESMEAIAHFLGVSRSTVSRLIKQARETGVVRIALSRPESDRTSLEARLFGLFGVTTQVVTMRDSLSEVGRLDRVARAAAEYLGQVIEDGTILGIAWGTTIVAVASHLVRHEVADCVLVQLHGAANDMTTGIDYVSNIMSGFAAAFSAESILFPVPAFFGYAETRDMLWREPSVTRVLDLQLQCTCAVFGVGSLVGAVPSHVYAAGYINDDDVADLIEDNVVGDVCTVLLRQDGSWSDVSLNSRASGPTPEQLQRIPRRIGVVAGVGKARALLAALRAGTMTDLVVDEQTARKVLQLV